MKKQQNYNIHITHIYIFMIYLHRTAIPRSSSLRFFFAGDTIVHYVAKGSGAVARSGSRSVSKR